MLPRLHLRVSQKLLNTSIKFQKTTECQFSGLAYNLTNIPSKKDCVLNVHKHLKVHGIYFIRCESTAHITKEIVSNTSDSLVTPKIDTITDTNSSIIEKDLIHEIPDIPVPIVEEITKTINLHANGEPTFESLGLGGYGPFGLFQYFYEWLHISCDLPWWATIILTSTIIKLLTFPCSIAMQKNNAKLNNVLPQMVKIQENMTDARKCGNSLEAAHFAYELESLFLKNNIKIFPITNIVKFGAHIPIFIALREMASKPVESLKEGGFWWFTDLTIPDQYYLLPLCTTVTMYVISTRALNNSGKVSPLVRHLFKAIPVISFLFAMRFPGAILCHWTTSNFITLIENRILNIEKVRTFYNIPPLIKHKPDDNKRIREGQKKGFVETFQDAYTNMKISNKLSALKHADKIQFNKEAKGPLKKTFKYNPMENLSKQTSASMSAMKK
ncbi:mitochondrial inner membrane protein OXA1L [Apis cerana]|uniref:Mitochondrial inner membrane protein OXA1L n=1 Tax=Apis cerana cerana TaxID=94128 RepID=A0A2A3EH74_APICC|nr:mitochondrial inner membrane protein OXA1L [Apis cerana]XP_061937883.1 mitochondrial inner membrane protein OXA1L [Apis cerana]XP_061937884.1 mitochondrial inner membrane protein OXA1L [Apis cerana]XP_061937885.1 mitochondrial inner membrane protein OXA1L [Apis cerana]PBC31058.1 Mitochondrial inner membrane protein OXA1L [Apis cerana cerana]